MFRLTALFVPSSEGTFVSVVHTMTGARFVVVSSRKPAGVELGQRTNSWLFVCNTDNTGGDVGAPAPKLTR